jgi:Big-like domain-containing protein/fibronectin type III domain protein/reprolysin-like metallo-peptidase family M12B
LIVDNGGAYCGIGWVQRNPGSGFAGYAFQVADRGCLANSTLAHEHGHNMGMEHNPENSSVGSTPSSASYPWSFGHWVSGQFATIMTYNSICPSYCPRVLNFSNPDVLYNGFPTGILNQRDNAQTGDSTAPIVAAFRAGGGSGSNNPPAFTSDPISKPNATSGQAYSGSLSGSASDADADPLSFAKTGGPAWLTVAANGSLGGTPSASDQGSNSFTVSVSDGRGGSDTATLLINVVASLGAPSNLIATAVGTKRIDIRWTDNSTAELGFKIERSSNNGKGYSQIATVGAGVTSFSNTGLRSGRKYYYRMRAYTASSSSGYSNIASATAN